VIGVQIELFQGFQGVLYCGCGAGLDKNQAFTSSGYQAKNKSDHCI